MRHAETRYFSDPHLLHDPTTPLTERGRNQARAAAEILSSVEFDRIITSDASRTTETASIVTKKDAKEFEVWPELREIDSGRLDQISQAEVDRTFSAFLVGVTSGDETLFGGEPVSSLLDRVFCACELLRSDPGWHNALAVLHGVVNRAILSWALLGPDRKLFLGGLEQAAGCLNIIDIDDKDVLVRAMNYCVLDPLHSANRTSTMESLHKRYLQTQAPDGRGAAD